jgi:phage-related protein
MAGKNQVTLTFAGDTDKLEKAFDRVGAASKDMGDKVSRDTTDSFDKVGKGFDEVDTKAMGFRDTITGVQDTSLGLKQIMAGDVAGGLLTLGMGVGDLASGFYNLIVPMAKTTYQFVVQKAAMVGHAIASAAVRTATIAWTAVQWALNVALTANPIGLVILAIVALVAAVVIAYKKSDTFRAIVQAAFRAVAAAGRFMWEGLKAAFSSISGGVEKLWSGLKRVFRLGVDALKGYARAITTPYRLAFDGIRAAWNSTVGGKGFSVPSWIPGIGGKSFRIPTFHTGGVMPGAPGSEGLALLQAGETVTPAGQGGAMVLEIHSGGSKLDDLLVEVLRKAVRNKGGSVQVVLGS